MKFTLAVIAAALSASPFAAGLYLDQNAVCGDSIECSKNCLGGGYHVASDRLGNVHFGCSTTVKYSNPDCSFGLEGPDETQNARAVCDTVGGTLCRHTYLTGRRLINKCVMADEDVAAFSSNCKAANGTFHTASFTGKGYALLTGSCEKTS